MQNDVAMQVGLSACHAFDSFPSDFLEQTLDKIEGVPWNYFELSRFDCERWIEYPILEKLNACKHYDPQQLAVVCRAFSRVHAMGRRTGLWMHDLYLPKEVLSVYPELSTPRGDLDLSSPLLTEFMVARLNLFFSALPDLDVVVLTMTETTFPVMHRFDNQMSPEAAVSWLLQLYLDACQRHGKELVVRPFSANAEDYRVVIAALDATAPNTPVMLKSDPFDWNPFLGISPYFAEYAEKRPVIMELDLAGEYFGRAFVPGVALDYLQERLEFGRQNGITRYVGRIDRHGVSALQRSNQLNVQYYCDCLNGKAGALPVPAQWIRQAVASRFPLAADPESLAAALNEVFESVIKHLFYVDGQLLFHAYFGDLAAALTCMMFEVLRPAQSLAHLRDEWSIRADRVSPDRATARQEKEAALARAQELSEQVRQAAPAYAEELVQPFQALARFTELYLRLVELVQAYVAGIEVEANGQNAATEAENLGISEELTRFRAVVEGIAAEFGEDWQRKTLTSPRRSVPELARIFANEVEQAFQVEQALARQYRIGYDGVVDRVFCGMPGEGHCLEKLTHGAPAVFEAGRWHRRITRSLTYTLQPGDNPVQLQVEVRGNGLILVNGTCGAVFDLPDWGTLDLGVVEGACRIQVEKTGTPDPGLRLILARAR